MHTLRGALALIAMALLAAGCGGGGDGSNPGKNRRGGELTVVSIGDVTSLDPGYWYYAYDYQVLWQPTQRALYGWRSEQKAPTPDVAASMPTTSADGKTVTIKLKTGIRYSPPLQDRTVSSADVKYAIERTFLPSVRNGYSAVYYNDIVGAKAFADGKAKEVTGIQTPNDRTLVLKLRKPIGVISNGQSLALPGTAAVPKDYAARYDAKNPSTYGSHQVFTGPYMIVNDGKGNVTGYKANRRIELVRNPSWKASTDFRPAYVDKILVLGGNDIDVASRRILSGEKLVNGDFAAPPVNVLRTALSTRKDQVTIVPSGGNRFISLNTTIKPFDDVNVRRAASAALDRTALRLTRGGPTLGPIATHYLPPGMGGFEQAGGTAGTFDFAKSPRANLELARAYMKKAGFKSGRYSGPALSMVGDNQAPASRTGEAVQSQLEKLGFKFDYRQVDRSATLSGYCGSSTAHVALCPNGGWVKDFFDPQSMLDPVFNGENISPENSPNWSQVNDPEINAALDLAVSETDPDRRARAYADLDRMVTSRAYVLTWLWDNQVNIKSEDVDGVVNTFNGSYDLTATSLR